MNATNRGMTMSYTKRSALLLAAIAVLCSACTTKTTTTATYITPTSQEVAAIKWDEAVAASTSARVNNTSLIFMR